MDIKSMNLKGALIASAVAGLMAMTVACGSPTSTNTQSVKCSGINDCSGKGACNGDGHDCAGKNTCKGKGWVTTTKADCDAKKGTVVQ